MTFAMFASGMRGSPKGLPRFSRSVAIDAGFLQSFRARPVVVLSPHFDDACFSLAAFLWSLGRGDLVNIFTQGDHLPSDRGGFRPEPRDVFAVRDTEDGAFAKQCGLTRHDLGCEEPSLRGRRPSELEFVEDDIDQMERPVLATLKKLALRNGAHMRGVLLAPLGIGRHVNHRATALLALRFRSVIEADYDLYLYEDLPYAQNPLQRRAALTRAQCALGGGQRFVMGVEWDMKKPLVELYASQFRKKPTEARFRPGVFRPRALHEAFWSVPPRKSYRGGVA